MTAVVVGYRKTGWYIVGGPFLSSLCIRTYKLRDLVCSTVSSYQSEL